MPQRWFGLWVGVWIWGMMAAHSCKAEVPLGSAGIVILKTSSSQPAEFAPTAVYYTTCDQPTGAPLYEIHTPSGRVIKVESWAIAELFPFDACLSMDVVRDSDAAFLADKQQMFAAGAKKFSVHRKVLGSFADALADATKRYANGQIRIRGVWEDLDQLRKRQRDAQAQAEEQARSQEKMRELADTYGPLAPQLQEPLSTGMRRVAETAKRLADYHFDKVEVTDAPLPAMLEYLKVKMREDPRAPAISLEIHGQSSDYIAELEGKTITYVASRPSLYETLREISVQTQTRFAICRDRVVFLSLKEASVYPECRSADDWKSEASRLFPDLAREGSKLFGRVSKAVKKKRESDADYFAREDWPLRIAEEEADKLGIDSIAARRGPDLVEYHPPPARRTPVVASTSHSAPPQKPASPRRGSVDGGVGSGLAGGGDWVPGPRPASPQTGPANSPPPPQFNEPLEMAPPADRAKSLTHVEIARASIPSVATVLIYDEKRKPFSQGSGFVAARNIVVTNFHVINHKELAGAAVQFPGEHNFYDVDGLLGVDEKADLAALHISNLPIKPLPICRGGLPEIGSDVYAIGSPQGLDSTFSSGLISALRRSNEAELDRLQMTAPISHGSSGGPVVNEHGEVVGVSEAFIDGQNLNLAIPVSYVLRLLGVK